MKTKNLLSLLLALVLVISCAAPVFAATDYETKARNEIKATLSGYGVNGVANVIDSMDEDELRVIQENRGTLESVAAQLSADIKNATTTEQVYDLIVAAFAKVEGILDEAGISVDLDGLTVTATANGFLVSGVEVNGANASGTVNNLPIVVTCTCSCGTATGSTCGCGTAPSTTVNCTCGTAAGCTCPAGTTSNTTSGTTAGTTSGTTAGTPSYSSTNGTTLNPTGVKTGDSSLAIALVCLAVVGGALVAGTRKSLSMNRI